MVETIQEIFKNIFNDNAWLATMIISMIPIVELRGGIPFGMSKSFWGANALTNWESLGWSFLGSSIVVPFLALLFLPIINWLKTTKLFKKFATKIEDMIKSKSQKISDKANSETENQQMIDVNNLSDTIENDKQPAKEENVKKNKFNKQFFAKYFGVMLFVAIPIPLTGVWTGTAIAVMLGLKFWQTCSVVIIGNLIAGVIMQTICAIFPNFTTWILIIFLAITFILIIFGIIKNKIRKNKAK